MSQDSCQDFGTGLKRNLPDGLFPGLQVRRMVGDQLIDDAAGFEFPFDLGFEVFFDLRTELPDR